MDNDIIKTFIKIDTPKVEDKPYYKIDESKKIITLFDQIIKDSSDKSSDFEEDYIFDEKDDNSLIYDEICKNTIKEALNGISYSFISYGDSNSDKIKLIIGDIAKNNINIHNMGIFPKLLNHLINKEKKSKYSNEKINVKISYFLIHDNDMLDLSNIKYNKDFNVYNLYENKIAIKNEENINNTIKKEKINNINDEFNFINTIFNLLITLEGKEESKNIFTRSHICIIIYITNESTQITSNINFVILNGSEYLYSGKTEKFKSLMNNDNNKKANKKTLEGIKIALETHYTYETIFNLVKLKIFIDNNIDSSNTNEINLVIKKNKKNSKLTTALYNIFLNMQKAKFRIIGTVTPNMGLYQNFKDTLIFLFDFYKIKKTKKKQSNTSINNNSKTLNKNENNSNAVNQLQKRNSNQYYDEIQKDNLIFELENKVNGYKKKIEELKAKVSKKEEKINLLEETYQEQINILKKKFNFTGDINILISGDENTKEAEYVKNLKDSYEKNIRNEGNLRLLQKELNNAEDEIKRLRNKEQIIDGNDTMIKYYLSMQHINEERKKDYKYVNDLKRQIEELNDKLKSKDKLIEKYKKEIDEKTKLFFNLPKALKESYVYKPNEEKENKDMENNLGEDNLGRENDNYMENKSLETDNLYTNEMERIKKENQKKIDVLKLNFDNLIKEKNNQIKTMEYNYELLKDDKKKDLIKYGNEIVKLNKILMNFISNYKRIYPLKSNEKYNLINYTQKKEEFDKIIESIDEDINFNNFPLLYQTLIKKKQLKMNKPLLYSNVQKAFTPINKINKNIELPEEEKNIKAKKKEKASRNNLKIPLPIKIEQINTFFKEETNNKNILLSKEHLEQMDKESIINHCINLNNKLIDIEKYLEKYAQYKRGFSVEEFEKGEKYKDEIIDELKKKCNKLSFNLDEQIRINNKNVCIINSQKRRNDKLEKNMFLYNNILKSKKPNTSLSLLSFNKSTVYNSSALDYNSINSNNSINNNIINNKSLKKSNSCLNINNNSQKKIYYNIKNKIKNEKINSFSRVLSPKIHKYAY